MRQTSRSGREAPETPRLKTRLSRKPMRRRPPSPRRPQGSDAAVKAATDATGALDGKKDPARLSGGQVRTTEAHRPDRGADQSQGSKLYVRQNFSPLFEVPVTIAPSDRPLGMHVFTAEVDKADAHKLRWPRYAAGEPQAMRNYDEGGSSRRERWRASLPK